MDSLGNPDRGDTKAYFPRRYETCDDDETTGRKTERRAVGPCGFSHALGTFGRDRGQTVDGVSGPRVALISAIARSRGETTAQCTVTVPAARSKRSHPVMRYTELLFQPLQNQSTSPLGSVASAPPLRWS